MAGSASGMAVTSINAMLEPSTVAARTQGPALGGQGLIATSDRMISSSQG